MKRWIMLAAAVLLVPVLAQPAQAQVSFGPQVVLWDLEQLGIGGRVDFGLADAFGIEEGFFQQLKGSVNGSYVFGESVSYPGGSASLNAIVINANAVVPFEVEGTVTPYAGAGLNHTRFSSSVSDTEFGYLYGYSLSNSGLNLLGGIELGGAAFAELQYSTVGAGYMTIAGGIMFGGGR